MKSTNGTYAYYLCNEVSILCPVAATTYGYYPNNAANLFFVAWFAILLILCLFFGIRSRNWWYTIGLGIGLVLETGGYVGRHMMTSNPWSHSGFQLQIVCIVLGPSFIAASIYLTLKHLVLYFGPQHSLLKAKLYPIVFIGCDIGSISLQAIGGGIAAVAGNKHNGPLLKTGDGLIVAGIAFQVFTMSVFGLLAAIFYVKYRRSGDHISSNELEKRNNPRTFCIAVGVAYVTILVRCIYRYGLCVLCSFLLSLTFSLVYLKWLVVGEIR
jgi:hypothetical protein